MKSYIVIGLGRFGSEVARQLHSLGGEVLAMDTSSELVQQISRDVTHAVVGDGQDIEVLKAAAECEKWILVWSKADLSDGPGAVMLPGQPDAQVTVSSLTGEGLEDLERAVAELFPMGEVPAGLTLTNTRQAEAVERAAKAVAGALDALRCGLTPDAVLTDAEGALNALGELTGRTLREDLVGRIFERFCVGK